MYLTQYLIIDILSNNILIIGLSDMQRPAVRLSTTSRKRTCEEQIPVLIKFVKPVFGFNSSHVSVSGGQLQRLASPRTLIFLGENILLFLCKLQGVTSLLSCTSHGSLI